MLILARKESERIRVGENVWITIVRISAGSVRLGIEAPRDLPVLREEIVIRQAEAAQQLAAEAAP